MYHLLHHLSNPSTPSYITTKIKSRHYFRHEPELRRPVDDDTPTAATAAGSDSRRQQQNKFYKQQLDSQMRRLNILSAKIQEYSRHFRDQ